MEFAKKVGMAVAGGLVLIVALGVLVSVVSPTSSDSAAAPSTTTPPLVTTTRPSTTTTPTVRSTTTSIAPATSTTLSQTTMELLYVATLRGESEGKPYNWVDAYDDDYLIDWALLLCDGWRDGLTFDEMALINIEVMDQAGWYEETDIEMLGYAMGVGTEAFCPEYNHVLGE